MNYRILGKSGLRVSALGFGGSSLGGVFGAVEQTAATAAVRAALDAGITFFDTAPYYGATRAESVLGVALRGVPRTAYVLATKVGRYGPSPADFDFSAARVERSVDESLTRLGVDEVDVLQAHDIEFGDLRQIVEETIPALQRIQAAGKARHIGISGLHLHLFERVLATVGGAVETVQSYCHLTLLDDHLRAFLPGFRARQVGVVNSAPLAMGLLTAGGPPDWHPAPLAVKERCREAAEFCRARGADLSTLALQFAAAEPDVAVTVVGMADPVRVAENVRRFASSPEPALLADVRRILAPVHNVGWPSGRPENQP